MLDFVEAAASARDADLNVEVIDDAFLTGQGIEAELPSGSTIRSGLPGPGIDV